MLDFILLGQIPGTDIYINFNQYLACLGTILLVLSLFKRHVILKWALNFNPGQAAKAAKFRVIISLWKALNAIGRASLLRFVSR